MSATRLVAVLLLIGAVVSPTAAGAAGSDAIVPGALRVDTTLDSIGVYWSVSDDNNTNSAMTLEYREIGGSQWLPAAPAMRATPETSVNGSSLGLNYWAASALFLNSGTAYDLRATITDPDGGGLSTVLNGTTEASLTDGKTYRHLYVVSGSGGGGTGTETDPIRGIQNAADRAQPGDWFHLAAGTYGPVALTTSGTTTSPIVFAGEEGAVIDGGNTNRGVVTLGTSSTTTSHIALTGLVIRNGYWGVDAQNTQYLDVIGNTIEDVGFGVYNRRDNDLERHQVVCDNVITGRTPWPGVGIPSERGIDLRGWGHTVCRNLVSHFGDGVSVQPSTGPSYGNDVYGNDVSLCVDDGIEVDYNQANVRVWGNRVTNSRMGVSVQPIRGGPAYILRNELVNLEYNSIKINNDPSGFFVINNSVVKLDNALSEGSSNWTNAVFRNNAVFGTRYAFEFASTPPSGVRSFDYNGWFTSRTGTNPWFKWNNVRYDRVSDLPVGVEDHGVELSLSHLTNGVFPASATQAIDPATYDLRPKAGTSMIDAGQDLPNVGDLWVSDGKPDLGAYELGQPLPVYGPGSATPSTGGPGPLNIEELAQGQLSDQLVRLYRAYFGRNPDSGGLAYWRSQRASGIPLGAVSNEFAQSPEFVAVYGSLSDIAFVDLVYQNVLARSPDAGGRAYWNAQLAAGLSRGQMMTGFSESPEYVGATGTVRPSSAIQGRVWRLYKAYFGRNADQSGFEFWVKHAQGGLSIDAISNEFARSREFVGAYGSLSYSAFIDLVYQNVLGRSPDPGGRTYWNSQLEAGLSRGQMMVGFSDSPEFILSTDSIPPG